MILQKLQLKNFKGIKDFSADFNSDITTVFGTNASGKTTLADSVSWLLYDKPSTDEVGFSPKPIGPEGTPIHYLDTTVEGVFDVGTFKKTLKENWTRKRGEKEAVFSGNVTEYFLNDVPCRKSDYDEAVSKICLLELVPVMTKSNYFSERLPWQDRRGFLLDICGDVTDEDVIESIPGMSDALKGHSVDDARTIAKAGLKRVDQRMKEIPVRIDEASAAVSGLQDNRKYWNIKIEQNEKEISEKKAFLLNIDTSSAIDSEIKWAALAYREKVAEEEHDIVEQINSLTVSASGIFSNMTALEDSLKHEQKDLESMNEEREKMLSEYASVKAEVFSCDSTCPTCGQLLPADKIEEARKRFNLSKSERLASLRDKAEKRCSKTLIAEKEKNIQNIRKSIDSLVEEEKTVNDSIDALRKRQKPATAFEDTEEYKSLIAKKTAVNGDSAQREEATKCISTREKENAEYRSMIATVEAEEKARKRIEELKSEMKSLQVEHDDFTSLLEMCDQFTVKKVELVDSNINSIFRNVKFKLFDEQINGAIKECCEVMVPGNGSLVRFSSANNAAKIEAGLEIIETFSAKYGISLPVFVDNAESVVRLNDRSMQIIRLVVSEKDKEMRVE